jgi:hypothetical protein
MLLLVLCWPQVDRRHLHPYGCCAPGARPSHKPQAAGARVDDSTGRCSQDMAVAQRPALCVRPHIRGYGMELFALPASADCSSGRTCGHPGECAGPL